MATNTQGHSKELGEDKGFVEGKLDINPKQDHGAWTQAYASLVRCSKLSPSSKLLLINLLIYQGQNEYAVPTLARLTKDLQASKNTILKCLKELESTGWVKVVRTKTPQGKKNEVNHYYCCVYEPDPTYACEAVQAGKTSDTKVSVPGGSKSELPPAQSGISGSKSELGVVQNLNPNNIRVNNTNQPTSTSTPIVDNDDNSPRETKSKNDGLDGLYPYEFEELWTVSPKQHGKEKAYREWQKVMERGYASAVILATFKKSIKTYFAEGYKERYFPSLERWFTQDQKYCWQSGKPTTKDKIAAQSALCGVSDGVLEVALAQSCAEAEKLYARVKGMSVGDSRLEEAEIAWHLYFAGHKEEAREAYLRQGSN